MNSEQNRWARYLVVLAGLAMLTGVGLTLAPIGPMRSAALWLIVLIGALVIVSAVGWAFTEIRQQEKLAEETSRAKTSGLRLLGYVGTLIVVALIAIGGAMIPSRFAPAVWALYIPIWLLLGRRLSRREGQRRSLGRRR